MPKLFSEVGKGVVERNVLYHFDCKVFVVREFSVVNPVSDDVAENAAEIFMARIAEEAAAVCKHTDER